MSTASTISSPTNSVSKRLSVAPRGTLEDKRSSSGRLLGMLRRRSLSRSSSASTEDSASFSLSASTIDFIQENIRRASKEDVEMEVLENGEVYYGREDEEARAAAALKLRKDIRLFLSPETYPSLSLMHLLQARNHFETSIEQLLATQTPLPQVPEENEQPEGGFFRKLRRVSSRMFLTKNSSSRPSSWRKSAAPQFDPVVASAVAELEQYLALVEAEIAMRTDCQQATV